MYFGFRLIKKVITAAVIVGGIVVGAKVAQGKKKDRPISSPQIS